MKCLIIDAVHSAIAEELGKYMQVDTHMLPTQEELVKLIPDYDVLIMRVDPKITKEIIDAAANLKVIGVCSVGLNHIDTKYAEEKGIKVFNANDVTLENVTIQGAVRNFGSAVVTDLSQRPEEPEQPPAIQPGDVYTPSETTGEYLTYSNQQIPIYAGVERNRFSQGDFMWDPDRPDRLIYTGDDYRTRFGIDVSAYQNRASANNTIDWEAAKADGVEFAMVRIGLRGYGSGSIMEDAFYAQNIDGAMAAGIETGVYFFAQAITVEEAIEEADFVISLLEGHEIDGPVAYDWEMHDSTYRVYGTTPEMATACAVAFCERIEEAGYDAMVYAGQYVSYIKYDQGALEPYLSWYPEYKSESSELLYPTLYYHMDYWQYSSKCSVAGIGGNVDVNLQFIRR